MSASYGSGPLPFSWLIYRRKIHRCAVNNLSSLRCLWSMWPFLSELVALSASSVSPYLGKTPLLGKKPLLLGKTHGACGKTYSGKTLLEKKNPLLI